MQEALAVLLADTFSEGALLATDAHHLAFTNCTRVAAVTNSTGVEGEGDDGRDGVGVVGEVSGRHVLDKREGGREGERERVSERERERERAISDMLRVVELDATTPIKFSRHLIFPHLMLANTSHAGALMRALRGRVSSEVWCSVVQCGAVWCSVVQCGAVWCSVV